MARKTPSLETIRRQESQGHDKLDWLFEIEAKATATHIPTPELRLLLANAERNGFGDRPHAKAYRAELLTRAGRECVNCGERISASEPSCKGHCTRCIPPAAAARIHTEADLRDYQRSQGADV